jgi:hypothetical protein
MFLEGQILQADYFLHGSMRKPSGKFTGTVKIIDATHYTVSWVYDNDPKYNHSDNYEVEYDEWIHRKNYEILPPLIQLPEDLFTI